MEYDFAVDTEELLTLSENIGRGLDSLCETIEKLYDNVNGMQDGWHGDSYNAFNENCFNYLPAMKTYRDVIVTFISMIDDVEEAAETLIADVAAILNK